MCRYISGKYGRLQIEYALRFRWKHLVRLSFAHAFHELPEHRFSQLWAQLHMENLSIQTSPTNVPNNYWRQEMGEFSDPYVQYEVQQNFHNHPMAVECLWIS